MILDANQYHSIKEHMIFYINCKNERKMFYRGTPFSYMTHSLISYHIPIQYTQYENYTINKNLSIKPIGNKRNSLEYAHIPIPISENPKLSFWMKIKRFIMEIITGRIYTTFQEVGQIDLPFDYSIIKIIVYKGIFI